MKQIIVIEELSAIGLRVVRGRDWHYGNQDVLDRAANPVQGAKGVGTIVEEPTASGWVRVVWDTGYSNSYRVKNGSDLYVYSPETKPTIQELRSGLEEASKYVKVDYETYEMERGYDTYGKSLKPNKNDHRDTRDSTGVYTGNPLYLPSKSFTLQRGERPEGRRLQG
jgi:hypothetical protein